MMIRIPYGLSASLLYFLTSHRVSSLDSSRFLATSSATTSSSTAHAISITSGPRVGRATSAWEGASSNLTISTKHVSSSRPIWKIPNCGDEVIAFAYASPSSDCAARSSFASFGKNGDCTDAYASFNATQPSTLKTSLSVTYTTLANGEATHVVSTVTNMVPAGEEGFCCASGSFFDCVVEAQDLELVYWPAATANTACLPNEPYDLGNKSRQSTKPKVQNGTSAAHHSGYVVGEDGFTYTSPSVYVRFPAVSARDNCGPVGPTLTSKTLAFAPGDLSTVRGYPNRPSPYPLNVADLPCGPNGAAGDGHPLGGGIAEMLEQIDDMNAHRSEYRPYIQLPQALFDLAPAWSWCNPDYGAGQDPPRTLNSAGAMIPAQPKPTKADENARPPIPAAPSAPIPELPVETGAKTSLSSGPKDSSSNVNPATDRNHPSILDPPTQARTSASPITSEPATPVPLSPGSAHLLPSSDPAADSGPPRPNMLDAGYPTSPNGVTSADKETPSEDSSETPPLINTKHATNQPASEPVHMDKSSGTIQGLSFTNNAASIDRSSDSQTHQSGAVILGSQAQNIPTSDKKGRTGPKSVVLGDPTASMASFASTTAGQDAQSDPASSEDKHLGTSSAADVNMHITIKGEILTVLPNNVQSTGKALRSGPPNLSGPGDQDPSTSPATDPDTHTTFRDETVTGLSDTFEATPGAMGSGHPLTRIDGTPRYSDTTSLAVEDGTDRSSLLSTIVAAQESPSSVEGEIEPFNVVAIVYGGSTMTQANPAVTINDEVLSLGPSISTAREAQTANDPLPSDSAAAPAANLDAGNAFSASHVSELSGISGGRIVTTSASSNSTSSMNETMPFLGRAREALVPTWAWYMAAMVVVGLGF